MEENREKASILKDIDDRMQLIQNYRQTRYLDRDKAIDLIQRLRLFDKDVAMITVERLAVSSTPFTEASDQGIVDELVMQVGILTAKLAK